MGGGKWSSDAYATASTTRAATNTAAFDYSAGVSTGRYESKIHEDLDPKKMVDGKREARDSEEHPESLPIMILFDVTGSMGNIPEILQKKLCDVMDVIISKAGVEHPQILVGSIGDYNANDRYPFQIGQFESDNRLDDQLRNIILEGGGGGSTQESYALAYYFAAYFTETDALTKRGKKGYLFTIGDEQPYPVVTAREIQEIFGVEAAQDQTVESLLAAAQEKWDIYHLHAMDGSYPKNKIIHEHWSRLLGERFVKMDNSSMCGEIIAGLIHMIESSYDLSRVVDDMGITGDSRIVVENALAPLNVGSRVSVAAVGELPAGHDASSPDS